MGLKITRASAGEVPGSWYVPEFRGNRLAPEDEQFSVELLPLTAAQLQTRREHDFGGKQQARALKAFRDHRNAILSSRIRAVEGIADAEGTLVADGKALVQVVAASDDPGFDDLLDEIYGALIDGAKLAEGRRPS